LANHKDIVVKRW